MDQAISPSAAPAPVAPSVVLGDAQTAHAHADAAMPVPTSTAPSESILGEPDAAMQPDAPKDDKLAKRFAALSRRERELRAKEKTIKDAEQRLRHADEADKLAKEDPLAFIERYGLDYSALTQRVLARGADKDPVAEVREEIAALKAQAEAERQAARSAAVESADKHFRTQIRAAVDAGAEQYELIRTAGEDGYEEVYALIAGHYNDTIDPRSGVGQIMPIDRAAKLVEDQLLVEARKLVGAKKLATLFRDDAAPSQTNVGDATKKVGSAAIRPGAVGDEATPNAQSSKPIVTLTNGHASVANPLPGSAHWRSVEESKARAAKLLKFTR